MMSIMIEQKSERRFTPLDYLAIIGGMINAIVIGGIIGYWFLH